MRIAKLLGIIFIIVLVVVVALHFLRIPVLPDNLCHRTYFELGNKGCPFGCVYTKNPNPIENPQPGILYAMPPPPTCTGWTIPITFFR
jgi:hypothetical protein